LQLYPEIPWAIDAEATVWGFISDILQDPRKISAGMETLIEQE
jgi:hypothetical protein